MSKEYPRSETHPDVVKARLKCWAAQRKYLNAPVAQREEHYQVVKRANEAYAVAKYGRALTVPQIQRMLAGHAVD